MTAVPEQLGTNIQHAGTAVELQDLTLRAGDCVLLQHATAQFKPGQISLIVGRSGVGKSLLLRLIAGLIDADDPVVSLSGAVRYGADQAGVNGKDRSVGVVFQHFALFDELSPGENVRFAFAHRRSMKGDGSAQSDDEPERLLEELDIPRRVRTASLSGGQRQRLAIARTLAGNPDVVLYDEPTSGLDRVTAGHVARLIQTTHASHPKTSIVVTHDYEALLPIADQVYLFDPATRSLRDVDRSQWSNLHALLAPESRSVPHGPASLQTPAARPAPYGSKVIQWIAWFFAATASALQQAALLPLRLMPSWHSTPWGMRFLLHYLRLVAGPSAWAYVLVAGGIAAFVATYFTFRFLPFRSYTEPLVIENLLNALGFSLYRILVPVLITVLIAARCGAAVASDVAGKVYGQQVDAMRSLNAKPEAYLYTGILHAFLLGTPVLVLLAFLAARFTSVVTFSVTHPQYGPFFWETHFHRELIVPGQILYGGTIWLLAKLILCAAGTATIAYNFGSKPKHSGRDVSSAITATILWATLFVLAVHCAFAFYEFDGWSDA
jgi:ABC-type transporter Mla maintaining outer membrane lipid asymmetry ATPase subunit MlaF/ABC-type transporter Mla maintaining outer membrane lipid asymmetry permease subunit MlaE